MDGDVKRKVDISHSYIKLCNMYDNAVLLQIYMYDYVFTQQFRGFKNCFA